MIALFFGLRCDNPSLGPGALFFDSRFALCDAAVRR